jgi:hypothetical protein
VSDEKRVLALARAQERRLPHVRAGYYPDDGHLVFFSRIGDILPDLLGR